MGPMATRYRQMISVTPRGGGEVHAAELMDPSARTACGEDYGGWVVAPGRVVQVAGRKNQQVVPATVTCELCKRSAFMPVSEQAVPEHRAALGRRKKRSRR